MAMRANDREEQELIDEFLATTSFDETRDWRKRDDLDVDDDELHALSARKDEALEERAVEALEAALTSVLPKMLIEAMVAGGKVAIDALAVQASLTTAADQEFRMRFDAKNLSVIEWAKKHAAALVADVVESTRNRIRLASEEYQEDGDWEFYHDRILAAVGDEARADLIARHETMLAAGEGQRQGWNQAEELGLLVGNEKREWIITDDERTCPICSDLAGTLAPVGGTYADGIEGPPAHVQCRCTEGIVG